MKKIKVYLKEILYVSSYYVLKKSLAPSINNINSIHFLCHGNICRSPFAEQYAKKVFKDRNINIQVSSSGILLNQTAKPPANAVSAAEYFGVDLSSHIPCSITEEMVASNSVTICMHFLHYKYAITAFPQYRNRFSLLKHFMWPKFILVNIEDPFNKKLDTFISCFKEICMCIDHLSDMIVAADKTQQREEVNR